MAGEQGSNRRKLRNFLVEPKVQLKYGGFFVLIALASLLLIAVPGYFSLSNLLAKMIEVYRIDPEAADMVRRTLFSWLVLAVFNSLALGLIAFNVGVVLTHRIFGALVPIRRQITQLKEGNYEAKVSLRPNDELKDLAEDLNSLAVTLDQKYGKSTKAQ